MEYDWCPFGGCYVDYTPDFSTGSLMFNENRYACGWGWFLTITLASNAFCFEKYASMCTLDLSGGVCSVSHCNDIALQWIALYPCMSQVSNRIFALLVRSPGPMRSIGRLLRRRYLHQREYKFEKRKRRCGYPNRFGSPAWSVQLRHYRTAQRMHSARPTPHGGSSKLPVCRPTDRPCSHAGLCSTVWLAQSTSCLLRFQMRLGCQTVARI